MNNPQLPLCIVSDNSSQSNERQDKTHDEGILKIRPKLSEEAYQKISNEYPKHHSFETTLKGKTGQYKLYEIL